MQRKPRAGAPHGASANQRQCRIRSREQTHSPRRSSARLTASRSAHEAPAEATGDPSGVLSGGTHQPYLSRILRLLKSPFTSEGGVKTRSDRATCWKHQESSSDGGHPAQRETRGCRREETAETVNRIKTQTFPEYRLHKVMTAMNCGVQGACRMKCMSTEPQTQ